MTDGIVAALTVVVLVALAIFLSPGPDGEEVATAPTSEATDTPEATTAPTSEATNTPEDNDNTPLVCFVDSDTDILWLIPEEACSLEGEWQADSDSLQITFNGDVTTITASEVEQDASIELAETATGDTLPINIEARCEVEASPSNPEQTVVIVSVDESCSFDLVELLDSSIGADSQPSIVPGDPEADGISFEVSATGQGVFISITADTPTDTYEASYIDAEDETQEFSIEVQGSDG